MNSSATLVPPGPRPTLAWSLAALAPCLLIVLGTLLVGSGGHDDSHITAWSAYALVEHGGLYNHNGVLLEQSSSLLHVLVLALLYGATGLALPTLSVLTSAAFGVATVLMAQRLGHRIDPALALPAGLLTATSPYILYWSFGGLETTMAAFGAIWLVAAVTRFMDEGPTRPATWGAVGALAFVLLTRPEAPFVCACLFLGTSVRVGCS